jgi:hypothetical protein
MLLHKKRTGILKAVHLPKFPSDSLFPLINFVKYLLKPIDQLESSSPQSTMSSHRDSYPDISTQTRCLIRSPLSIQMLWLYFAKYDRKVLAQEGWQQTMLRSHTLQVWNLLKRVYEQDGDRFWFMMEILRIGAETELDRGRQLTDHARWLIDNLYATKHHGRGELLVAYKIAWGTKTCGDGISTDTTSEDDDRSLSQFLSKSSSCGHPSTETM